MPGQNVQNVHVDAVLTNLARLYTPKGFIADIVCPTIPVVHETDLYYVFDQGPFFADDVDDLVPDRGKPRKVEFAHSTEGYIAVKRELAWDISDRERKNADSGLNLERNKQNGTLGRLMLKKERRVANLLRKTANGGSLNLGGNASAKWDNSSTTFQTLLTDVMAGKTAVRQAIGASPNVLVIPAAVAEGMHKSLIYQAIQYTYGDKVDRALLETEYPVLPDVLFGMRVLVGGTIYNTAVEGQTASYSDVWGEAVRMLYVNPNAALEEPSVAYSIQSRPLTTRRWRDEEAEVDSFAVGYIGVEKIVATDAGYEIADTLT